MGRSKPWNIDEFKRFRASLQGPKQLFNGHRPVSRQIVRLQQIVCHCMILEVSTK